MHELQSLKGVNVKSTWLGSSRIKGFDKVATLICNGPTQTTRLGITITSSLFVPSLKSKTFCETKGSPFTFAGCCSPFQRQQFL